jgi:uncharacterized lipoprotein NlpE involved in copper resistance
MKALIFTAALAALLLIGCENNATGPADYPAVSQSSARTLPISTVIERLDANGLKRTIEVNGSIEYSLVEYMIDEAEAGSHAYHVFVTLRADLKDRVSQETWKATGTSKDSFTFTVACKKCFTKNYAVERMGSELSVEYEILNNNLTMSQIRIPL